MERTTLCTYPQLRDWQEFLTTRNLPHISRILLYYNFNEYQLTKITMALRQWDPDLLQEEWFVALPTQYKWLYLWARGYASQAGVWKPSKILPLKYYYMNGQDVILPDFINKVNTSPLFGRCG